MNIKNLLVAVAVLALAFTASGQLGSPATVIDSTGAYTNSLQAGVGQTNKGAYVIDVSAGKEVALAFTGEYGSGTDNNQAVLIKIDAGVDGTHFATWKSWSAPISGTTSMTAYTNLTVLGMPFLRINYIYNSGSNTYLTNYNMKVFVKPDNTTK